MRQLGAEEKAALLLTAADEDDDEYNNNNNHEMTNSPSNIKNDDNFPVVAKRPRSYQRHRSSSSHPVLYVVLMVGVFLLGCVTGICIIFYRLSQDTEPNQLSIQTSTKIDLSVQTKLFQSIIKTNFMNLNR